MTQEWDSTETQLALRRQRQGHRMPGLPERAAQVNPPVLGVPRDPTPPATPAGPAPGDADFWSYWTEWAFLKVWLELWSLKNWAFIVAVLVDLAPFIPNDSAGLILKAVISVLSGVYVLGRSQVDKSGNGTSQEAARAISAARAAARR